MSIIKHFLQLVVNLFFNVYFGIFGKPVVNSSLKKTLELYRTNDFSELFQTVRIWDAPFEHIEKYIPKKGVVVDLGCGDGLLANYIAISRPETKVYGLDINKDRVKEAQKGVKNTKFVHGDITQSQVPKADAILLIHVLHHLLSFEAQEKLLLECQKKLKKKGALIVAEIAQVPVHKYIFTWLIDHIAVPILFEGRIYNPKVLFRKTYEWEQLFKKLNLKSKTVAAHKDKPFSHIIFYLR